VNAFYRERFAGPDPNHERRAQRGPNQDRDIRHRLGPPLVAARPRNRVNVPRPRHMTSEGLRLVALNRISLGKVRRPHINEQLAWLDRAEHEARTLPHRERYLQIDHRLGGRILAFSEWRVRLGPSERADGGLDERPGEAEAYIQRVCLAASTILCPELPRVAEGGAGIRANSNGVERHLLVMLSVTAPVFDACQRQSDAGRGGWTRTRSGHARDVWP
jgi:hypothetical protein